MPIHLPAALRLVPTLFVALLAAEAGGTQKCGQAIFATTDDPDYQRILKTFVPIHALLNQRPRPDMQ